MEAAKIEREELFMTIEGGKKLTPLRISRRFRRENGLS